MNLPVILDIVLGLIFIYLTLSLLASEFQELLTTILQWRAEHLKKSIEVLISGSADPSTLEAKTAHQLANQLYNHPFLRDLNQEAKGTIEQGFRKISDFFKQIIYLIFPQKKEIFGNNNSGPSYIPPESFARTLIDQLKIKEIAQLICLKRVNNFLQNKLIQKIQDLLDTANFTPEEQILIQQQINKLSLEIEEIYEDLRQQNNVLDLAIERIETKLDSFIKTCQILFNYDDPTFNKFYNYLQILKNELFNKDERKALLSSLKPTLNEVGKIIAKNPVYYAEFEQLFEDKNSQTYQDIVKLIDSLPPALQESIAELTNRVKTTTLNIEEDIQKLQQQIESWFDRSMMRAGGVYKRNAKGVAILIGLTVAIIANADTLNIVSSLSKNSVLRTAIIDNAQQLVINNPAVDQQSIKTLNSQVRQALEDVPLPLGWGQQNIAQQMNYGWKIPYLSQFLGWLISGFAISMGSSFWFDLLSKIMNVRNVGKTKDSASE